MSCCVAVAREDTECSALPPPQEQSAKLHMAHPLAGCAGEGPRGSGCRRRPERNSASAREDQPVLPAKPQPDTISVLVSLHLPFAPSLSCAPPSNKRRRRSPSATVQAAVLIHVR